MSETAPRKGLLILAYGNPGRQDDGLGPAVAGAVEKLNVPGVTVDAAYQLNIEDAVTLAEHDFVLFVDASTEAQAPFGVRRLSPSKDITFTSHTVSPESVLAITEDNFGGAPVAWVMGIRGYAWELEEELTAQGQENLNEALAFVKLVLWAYEENAMTAEAATKTILIVDDDPDIRASMRIVLEAAGFSVGEAANGEEGLKVAERISPDAVIMDLMMETVDAGAVCSTKLKEDGYKGPIYLLSAAGDAVRYNIDAKELGLAGIFQKPIDHKTLVGTLQSKLG